jgi:hypothetical protein
MSKKPKIDHDYDGGKDKLTITIHRYSLKRKKTRDAIIDELKANLKGAKKKPKNVGHRDNLKPFSGARRKISCGGYANRPSRRAVAAPVRFASWGDPTPATATTRPGAAPRALYVSFCKAQAVAASLHARSWASRHVIGI